ncbi:MAG: hypothetical protein FWC57_02685 [Endomicrobia bacterium]|nr:hypothetical protein [Endomicrobiia bacterium]
MKNILIIISFVILFFLLLFGLYVAAFKIFFSSPRMINQTKRIARMAFQRDVSAADISLSPFGALKVKDFSMAARGGFSAGTLIKAGSLAANIKILRLFSREIIIDSLEISGVDLHLNYENKRKFDYGSFFSNIGYLFMQDGSHQGIVRNVELRRAKTENANVYVMTDYGRLEFKNVKLEIELLDDTKDFAGSASLDFSYKGINTPVTFNFTFNKTQRVIYIKDFVCKDFMISADGNINLLDDGSAELEFVAKINKNSYVQILKNIFNTDFPFNEIIQNPLDEDMIITYPSDKKNPNIAQKASFAHK